jgi:hypothetical protein
MASSTILNPTLLPTCPADHSLIFYDGEGIFDKVFNCEA